MLMHGSPSLAAKGEEAQPTKAQAPEPTTLTWTRATWGGRITVKATKPGPTLDRAHRDVERLALYLDALRTIRPHVLWRKIIWRKGIVQVQAVAETAIYGNVAIQVARRLFQGYASAGSGVQQVRNPGGIGWPWKVRMLLAPPPSINRPSRPERSR